MIACLLLALLSVASARVAANAPRGEFPRAHRCGIQPHGWIKAGRVLGSSFIATDDLPLGDAQDGREFDKLISRAKQALAGSSSAKCCLSGSLGVYCESNFFGQSIPEVEEEASPVACPPVLPGNYITTGSAEWERGAQKYEYFPREFEIGDSQDSREATSLEARSRAALLGVENGCCYRSDDSASALRRIDVGEVFCSSEIFAAPVAPTPRLPHPSVLGDRKCSLKAYVADQDPKGLNVRAGPGPNHPVLCTLSYDTIVTITKNSKRKPAWIYVSSAEEIDSMTPDGSPVGFRPGWVYGGLVQVSGKETMELADFKSAPSKHSETVARAIGGGKVLGCQDGWIRTKVNGKFAWLAEENYCGNPVTTCA